MKKIAILAMSLLSIPVVCMNEAQMAALVFAAEFAKMEAESKDKIPYAKELIENCNEIMRTTCPAKAGGVTDGFVQAIKNTSPEAQNWCSECLSDMQEVIGLIRTKLEELEKAELPHKEDNQEEQKNKQNKFQVIVEDPVLFESFYKKVILKCMLPLSEASTEYYTKLINTVFDEEGDKKDIQDAKAQLLANPRYAVDKIFVIITEIQQQLRNQTQS